MKKFLVLLNAPTASFDEAMAQAGRAADKGMDEWQAWMSANAKAINQQVGGPVGKNMRVTAQGHSNVRNEVGGFLVIEAESLDDAVALMATNPHYKLIKDGYVDILEVMPMQGQA